MKTKDFKQHALRLRTLKLKFQNFLQQSFYDWKKKILFIMFSTDEIATRPQNYWIYETRLLFNQRLANATLEILSATLNGTHVALMDLVSLLRSWEFDLIIFTYLFLNSTPC